MSWRKLGHLYTPDGSRPWGRAYAANPIAEHIAGDRFKIYFSARDSENRSAIGWIEIDLNAPQTILRESEEPELLPGEDGFFDSRTLESRKPK